VFKEFLHLQLLEHKWKFHHANNTILKERKYMNLASFYMHFNFFLVTDVLFHNEKS